ncbi:hypothetical protein GGR56DRAFT_634446 [Xylariaceae sp. FL0804]|nr:hypothetical protein GGR56DRAFT_634446 [Xylariaceae sp. FL0804]
MASLDLKIENEDGPGSDTVESASPKAGLVHSLRQKWRPKADKASGTIYDTSARLAGILRNFLQPDSATSLDEAAGSILKLIPPNASHSTEVRIFGDYCVELADQIPYYHPSHLKLARLLQRLNISSKFTDKIPLPDGSEDFDSYQLLEEAMRDNIHFPEQDDPKVFVNFQAFVATAMAVGINGKNMGHSWGVQTMRDAFETRQKMKSWEVESYVMGAAQWILIYGQSLFQHIQCPVSKAEEQQMRDHSWRLGDGYPKPDAVEPRSVDRWRFWRDCFDSAAQDAGSGEECKKVARKAAELMKAIDMCCGADKTY